MSENRGHEDDERLGTAPVRRDDSLENLFASDPFFSSEDLPAVVVDDVAEEGTAVVDLSELELPESIDFPELDDEDFLHLEVAAFEDPDDETQSPGDATNPPDDAPQPPQNPPDDTTQNRLEGVAAAVVAAEHNGEFVDDVLLEDLSGWFEHIDDREPGPSDTRHTAQAAPPDPHAIETRPGDAVVGGRPPVSEPGRRRYAPPRGSPPVDPPPAVERSDEGGRPRRRTVQTRWRPKIEGISGENDGGDDAEVPWQRPVRRRQAGSVSQIDFRQVELEGVDDPSVARAALLHGEEDAPESVDLDFGEGPRESTQQVQMALATLLKGLEVPAPWGKLVDELAAEALVHGDARPRSVLLHEIAEIVRMVGDSWRETADELDAEALQDSPGYLPALWGRLVELHRRHRQGGPEHRDGLVEALELLHGLPAPGPSAVALMAELDFELGVLAEVAGDLASARQAYLEAAQRQQHPFFRLNLARIAFAEGDLDAALDEIEAAAGAVGESADADAVRGLLLVDLGEMLRRRGHNERARDIFRNASRADPTSLAAYRSLQILAWHSGDDATEIDGLKGQLALMVEQGRELGRHDARRKVLRRKAAAKFFRLASRLHRVGRHDDAVTALRDALGVRRHELLYLRALERTARASGDLESVDEALTRQIGLVVAPSLQALLLVDQAHARLALGDTMAAKAHLVRSLEIAPDCLPARVDLGRLLLRHQEWDALLALRDTAPVGERPDPNLDQAWDRATEAWRRGEILERKLAQNQEAANEYLVASRWQPNGSTWIRAAERTLLSLGRFDDLDSLYARGAEVSDSPQRRADLVLRSVRLRQSQGDLIGAIDRCEILVDIESDDLARIEELAHMLRRVGRTDAAIEQLEQLVDAGLEVGIQHLADTNHPAVETANLAVARSLRWLARLYETVGDNAEAARAEQRLLSLRPSDASGSDHLRQSMRRRGDWAGLLDSLATWAQTAPPERQRALRIEAAEICLHRLRDRRRALEIIEALATDFPDDPASQDFYEETLRDAGERAALATHLLARARRSADDAQERLRLCLEALALRRDALGDAAGALEAVDLMCAIAPDFLPALKGRAELLATLGRHEELALHLEQWVSHAGERLKPRLCVKLAHLYEFSLQLHEEALRVHEELLGMVPDRVESHWARARLAHRLGRHHVRVTALCDLADHVEDGDERMAILERAARLAEQLDTDAAEIWTRIIEFDPDHGGAQRGLERCRLSAGAHGRLLNGYLAQAKGAEGIHRAHFLMRIASVYEQMGRISDACEILRKVLTLEPGYDLARFELGRLARQVGDWETVAELEQSLADAAPTAQIRLQHLTGAAHILSRRLGKTREAVPLLRELVEFDPGDDHAFRELQTFYADSTDVAERGALLEVIERRLRVATDPSARADLLRDAIGASQPSSDKARAYADELLSIEPDDAVALELAAELAEREGQPTRATELLARRLEQPGGDRKSLLHRLGRIALRDLEDLTLAERALGELVGVDPTDLEAHRMLAEVDLRQRRPDRACARYKTLFERTPSAELASRVAELLHRDIGHNQEALSWYMRALDLDPLHAEATDGFTELMAVLDATAPETVRVHIIQDRLDWLVQTNRDALSRDPWDLDRLAALSRLFRLRGERVRERDVASALRFFGVADETTLAVLDEIDAGRPDVLFAGGAGGLTGRDVRDHVLPPAATGRPRRVFELIWDAIAAAEPDDLGRRGIGRGNRLGDQDARGVRVGNLARALHVFGVDLYAHPSDPYAVHALLTPQPALVLGPAIFEKTDDRFHHFRVARALETLRDGKALLTRPDAGALCRTVDEVLLSSVGPQDGLPLFDAAHYDPWPNKAAERVQKGLNRRLRKELKSVLEPGDSPVSADRWIDACREAPIRLGFAVCGDFGVAADAVAGTTFSLDSEMGPGRREAVMEAVRRDAITERLVGRLLAFLVSPSWDALRRQLRLRGEG